MGFHFRNEAFCCKIKKPGTRPKGGNPSGARTKSRDCTQAYLEYAAHAIPLIDAEIAKKCFFWMETNYI